MKVNQIYLIILLLLVVQNNYSQTDFKPGYYITNQDDTIYGLIDYRGDIRNSKVCVYKANENDESIQFQPGEIKAYRFIDSKYYVSKKIKTENDEKTVFLEYLVNGKADLYFSRNLQIGRYFIQKDGGELLELAIKQDTIYNEYGNMNIRDSYKYIGYLKAYLSDCMPIQKQIEKVELENESLINIVKNYHDYVCDGEKCIIYEKKLPPIDISFSPFIGVSYSKMEFSQFDFYENMSFENQLAPSLGVLFTIAAPRLNEKLSFQLALETSKNYFYGTLFTNNSYYYLHIHSLLLQSSASIKYTYPKGKVRPTIAIGGIYSPFIKRDSRMITEHVLGGTVNTYEENVDPVSPSVSGALVQLGCNVHLNEKWIVFANFSYKYCWGAAGKTIAVSDKRFTKIHSLNLSFGVYL